LRIADCLIEDWEEQAAARRLCHALTFRHVDGFTQEAVDEAENSLCPSFGRSAR